MDDLEKRFNDAHLLYENKQYRESFMRYLRLAEEGYENCQAFVGWMYFSGEGVEKNLSKAKYWYEKASNSGDSESLFYLGKIYFIRGDYAEALKKFKKAESKNYAPAIYRIGRLYQLGKGVIKDEEKAYSYFLQASRKGHLFAKKQISLFYMRGNRGFVKRVSGLLNYLFLIIIALRLGFSDQDEKVLT